MPRKPKPVIRASAAFPLRKQHQMLSTENVAKILNVSRPYVVKLVDAGKLGPVEKDEREQRRISASAVEAYRNERHANGRKALEELAATSHEAGLYDATTGSTDVKRKSAS